uniref:Response regulator n=1 Tax=Dictyoglomus thermophilum TaxID=14 RepID=A0A7C3RHW8_DICTH
MYKVLIVDDEPIIRSGLKKVINWENHGLRIVGDADNGEEALDKIIRLNPDLCIVDIKMPKMDGLELIKKVKEIGMRIKFIILTGYPEFEYAKKAIDLGVESYLLKPIDPEILKEKVMQIVEQIKSDKLLYELSRDKLLEKLIKGELKNVKEEDLNRIYNFNFPWDSYEIVLTDDLNIEGKKNHNIDSIIQTYTFMGNSLCFLIADIKNPYFRRKLMDVKRQFKKLFGFNISFFVGEKVFKLSDLPISYNTALKLKNKKFLFNQKEIITYPKEAKFGDFQNTDDSKIICEIIKAIEFGNLNNIHLFLEIKMNNHTVREDDEEEIKSSYLNLFINIINYFSSNYPFFKEISNKYLDKRIICEFYKKRSLIDLHNFVKEMVLNVLRDFSEKTGNNVLSQIIEYINANYYKDIKLKDLAKQFGYNSSYFGKIFRKYTGEKFNTYIDRIRINKAKELLLKGEKVVDVAEKVGYKDLDYFVFKFKKYTGKTPQAFKENIS